MLLEVEDLRVRYGKVPALNGVSLTVGEGEIAVLIGANGAGKTTLLNAISGLRPFSGSIRFRGRPLDKVAAYRRAAIGVGQVPEGRRIFTAMTVRENLLLGGVSRDRSGRARMAGDMDRIYAMFPRLAERQWQVAGTLSGGEQQMLAIGRALMARPALLLLDEPSMGLAPLIVAQIFEMIREINRDGTTVLLVEQNAVQALGLGQRGYVLEIGSIVSSGPCAALMQDPAVQAAYLGTASAAPAIRGAGEPAHPDAQHIDGGRQ
ncbi:MAG: ABC transporter ATP-binding protein [Rhizobiaceae bacterium]|nr:MAG: ABC transporter ATP-binding protein [Rhizobiaceae bacterium]